MCGNKWQTIKPTKEGQRGFVHFTLCVAATFKQL